MTDHPQLSDFQRDTLLWLLDEYDAGHAMGNWGVHWTRNDDSVSRSDSAVQSRALRSLERRGFILRRNSISGDPYYAEERRPLGRTTTVVLTPTGREVASILRDGQPDPLLTGNSDSPVSIPDPVSTPDQGGTGD